MIDRRWWWYPLAPPAVRQAWVMEPRRLGIAVATVFATSGTVFVAALFREAPIAIAVTAPIACMAWLGVYGWWHDVPALAAAGAWAAAATNTYLWSLVAIPLAVAIVTTGIAARAIMRSRRQVEASR